MLIKINGGSTEIPDGLSIQDLLAARSLPGDGIITELNGEIVKAEQRSSTRLNNNDNLEVIQVIGGG